jgi:transposase
VSEAVALPVEEARAYVRAQAAAHLDETGWWQEKVRAWLWVAATPLVAVFTLAKSRGAKVAQEFLGDFAGVLHSERWSAYKLVDVCRRQVCWAHLIRDFRGMVERGGAGARIGKGLLEEAKRIFEWWPRVRDGTLTRRVVTVRMRQVERRVGELLQSGEVCADARTAGMCKEIRKVFPALWTFVHVEGVEPTNNMAERDLRRAVLWRKACFGTDSATGSRYVERVLTVVMTLRKQKRAVHRYLAEACEARLRGLPPPSLLPVSHPAPLIRAA